MVIELASRWSRSLAISVTETNHGPAGYGVVSVAKPLERRVYEAARTPQVAGSKTLKIRYGPYRVPNAGKKNIVGESGVLYNYPHLNVERPCSGDCVLLGISAGLEVCNSRLCLIPR
jgi:hypothetical protein